MKQLALAVNTLYLLQDVLTLLVSRTSLHLNLTAQKTLVLSRALVDHISIALPSL